MASQQQSANQLVEAALALPAGERDAFLRLACRNSPQLRELVDELLSEMTHGGASVQKTRSGGEDATSDKVVTVTTPGSVNEGAEPPWRSTRLSRFLPGDVIGDRFLTIRFIARGGMGEVYEVQDRFLESVHVALKMILPKFGSDQDTKRRFQQEVLLARKVTHPNLCPIYDIFHCNEPAPPFSFLTMRLLPGRSLAEILVRTPSLPPDEAMAVFRQMADGLAALHAGGIIHRDIKPNNVMLDGVGAKVQLWITDFGLARLDNPDLTARSEGLLAGTRGYLAPELLLGEAPSQASDIFAFGVVLHEIFVGERPRIDAGSLSVTASPRLKSAEIPSEAGRLVAEFLAVDPKRRCIAFQQALDLLNPRSTSASGSRPGSAFWTRRRFVGAGAVAACAVAGGVRWKWEQISDLLHPLPKKRFVALLNWPASDARIKPILEGVIDAIGSELARAEAFDHDLLVLPHHVGEGLTSVKELNELRETLGANLVLAASGISRDKDLHLSLSVLDPSSGRPLREKKISWPLAEPISLPDKAVRAAAQLLDVSHYLRSSRTAAPDTQSADAYSAFQAAESYRKQENDTGLDAAIAKYKEAVELDPRYATAHAQLALAYCRFYSLHGDPAALSLARGNCETALSLNPNLVAGHLALASLLQQSGDTNGAAREISKALSLDPGNPRTLVYQGQFLTALNRWADAEDTFNRLLKTRPNDWLAHNELGALFNMEGKYPQAVMEFRAASLAAPKNALALNNLGAMYLQQGSIDEAKKSLKRSLDLNVNDSASMTMAATLRSEGKYADALPFGLKAVELNPAEANNWLELGDCYSLARGHHTEAIKAYAKAVGAQEEELRNDPVNGPGWMTLALSRVKAGAPQTALALMEKAERSLAPAGDLDSQLRKARTLELLGKREEALTTVAACLKRGATEFQFQTMPDMGALRDDPRYKTMVKSMPSTTQTNV
jgi:serine/threonine protein kinase/Tfp pilus assembly protein PilF